MKVNKAKLKAAAAKQGFSVKFDEKKEVIELKPKDKTDDLLVKFSELLVQNQSMIDGMGKSKDDTLITKMTELLIQNNRILSRVTEEVALFKESSLLKVHLDDSKPDVKVESSWDEIEVIPERENGGMAYRYLIRKVS